MDTLWFLLELFVKLLPFVTIVVVIGVFFSAISSVVDSFERIADAAERIAQASEDSVYDDDDDDDDDDDVTEEVPDPPPGGDEKKPGRIEDILPDRSKGRSRIPFFTHSEN